MKTLVPQILFFYMLRVIKPNKLKKEKAKEKPVSQQFQSLCSLSSFFGLSIGLCVNILFVADFLRKIIQTTVTLGWSLVYGV